MEIKCCGSQPSNQGPITLAPIGGEGRGEGARMDHKHSVQLMERN